MSLRRIAKELLEFQNDLCNHSNILRGGPINDRDILHWKITILGTEHTPYQGGTYDLDVVFPRNYPFLPPKIKFLTKIYHCSIHSKIGHIDCNILDPGDAWSPALTISKTILSLQTCMATGGNPLDPLCADKADLMLSNTKQFIKIASEWNVKYAKGDPRPNPIVDTSYQNFQPWQDKDRNKRLYDEHLAHVQLCKQELQHYHQTRFSDNQRSDMVIFIKTLTGRTVEIECRKTDFVLTVQLLLEKESGVPVDRQKLIFAGKRLLHHQKLSEKGICNHYTLHLVLKLRGKQLRQNDDNKNAPKEDESNEICTKLMKMGFEAVVAKNASQLFPRDLNAAITAAVAQKDNGNQPQLQNEQEMKQPELSPRACVEKQFHEFLKEIHLEAYHDVFKQNECCDMESIRYFDDDILKNDIGVRSAVARKRFLAKCKQMVQEMDQFKERGISSVLYKQLNKYGIVTMDILCVTIKNKGDLKSVYGIERDADVNALWDMMKRNEINEIEGNNNNDVDVQNAAQNLPQHVHSNNTPCI
eukprot:309158_1